MCYCDIDDVPSASWESHPVSIKTHTCCECDGEFFAFKTCETCENICIEAITEVLNV